MFTRTSSLLSIFVVAVLALPLARLGLAVPLEKRDVSRGLTAQYLHLDSC
jgi:hypothetical protein